MVFKDHLLQVQEWHALVSRTSSKSGRKAKQTNKELLTNIRRRHMRGSHMDRQPRKKTKTLSKNARRKLGKLKPV